MQHAFDPSVPFERQRQAGLCEFEAGLVYVVGSEWGKREKKQKRKDMTLSRYGGGENLL